MSFDPLRYPDDAVYLDDQLVPGIVEIKGLKTPREWEERMSFGMMGARLRYKGQRLSHFTLQVSLYTQEHWDDWIEFYPTVRRAPRPDRSQIQAITSVPSLTRVMRSQAPPLSIRNPLLEEFRINRVVIEETVAPVEDDKGAWVAEIKLIQYQRPVRILSTSGGREREAGTSAQDRQIAALTTELNDLAAEGNRK